MGKCIICGCDTDDFRGSVREENGKYFNDFQCEECTDKIIAEERAKWEFNFNKKVLPYLLKHNFKVKVTYTKKDKEIIEEFPIKNSDLMYCVDIIRKRMEEQGYYEIWIDVHTESYNDVSFEVVDYLGFELISNKKYCLGFHLELIGDNGLRL